MHAPEVSDCGPTTLAEPTAAALALLADGIGALRDGRITDGLDALTTARALDVDLGDGALDLAAWTVVARLARGDLREAMALTPVLGAYTDRGGQLGCLAHYALGEIGVAFGDPESAATHYRQAGAAAADSTPGGEAVPWRAGLAGILATSGRAAEATALAEEELAEARAARSPYRVAQALRLLSVVSPGSRRIEQLREALAAASDLPAGRLVAQIRTDLAALLILTHDAAAADEALELLRAAEVYAVREDLWPLQSRVRRLLARVGAEPAEPSHDLLDALTGTERRVVRLVTAGMRNREVAAELGVSVKAVEWHLSHVYRKLGVRSRVELGELLAPQAPQPAGSAT